MQTLDLPCNPTVDSPAPDPSAMSDDSSPIHSQDDDKAHVESNAGSKSNIDDSNNSVVVVKRERPSRACTQRAAARIAAAAEAEAEMAEKERKRKRAMKEKSTARVLKEESEEEGSFGVEDEGEGEEEEEEEENGREGGGSLSFSNPQCGKIVTQLVGEVEPAQVPRWNIRSMWQLASILNFLNVFRPLLNIKVEFSAEEFETALITPNNTLGDVHIPLLKAIPPVTRMALGHNTWVTVLCRKLRDWWHWVAEGDLPIVASHGAEIEAYKALDPEVRVVILKALCDIRVEQEDIRNYIDDSMKHGVHLSAFRKERIGGDSHGISYWYEDDPIIGHRLYREIRKVEVNKGKGKSVSPIPHSSYQWEAVATNFDEFLNVSDKLFSSKNRIEISVGKKLKNGMLPEIEKVHKRKEKQLKKQHRQALMLDNMISMDGLGVGRSLRDRKPVTYTFDDFDRSINEAIKVTKKKQPSPEPFERREPPLVKMEDSSNGRWDAGGPSQYPPHDSTFSAVSPNSFENDDNDDDEHRHYDDREDETLDRSDRRRRKKPKQYSVNEFVEPLSENDPDFESDEDIVGEVVYDDNYLRKRNNKRRKTSSSSESEEEYRFEEENPEEEEEEEDEEEDNDTSNTDEDSDNPNPRKFKSIQVRGRTRRGTRLRSVGELQSGLRRSKRSTRNRINYQQYEMSESEPELPRPEKSNALEEHYDTSDNEDEDNELSMGSQDFEDNVVTEEVVAPGNGHAEEDLENNVVDDEKQVGPREEESKGLDQESSDGGVREKRRFLDLNELAPGSGFDDGPALNRDGDDDEY